MDNRHTIDRKYNFLSTITIIARSNYLPESIQSRVNNNCNLIVCVTHSMKQHIIPHEVVAKFPTLHHNVAMKNTYLVQGVPINPHLRITLQWNLKKKNRDIRYLSHWYNWCGWFSGQCIVLGIFIVMLTWFDGQRIR